MNEEFVVAPKRNRRKIIKILCAVLVCLLCFSLGVGGTFGWIHCMKGESRIRVASYSEHSRVTAKNVCVDGKRIEGTVDGMYLYYTLDNDSLYDLYYQGEAKMFKKDRNLVRIEKKQDLEQDEIIKRPQGPHRVKDTTPDIAAFREEERRLYLDLWELTEGTYYVVFIFTGTFLGYFGGFREEIHVIVEFDIPAQP